MSADIAGCEWCGRPVVEQRGMGRFGNALYSEGMFLRACDEHVPLLLEAVAMPAPIQRREPAPSTALFDASEYDRVGSRR